MELNEKELDAVAGGKYVVVKKGEEWVAVKDKYLKEGNKFSTSAEANKFADEKNNKKKKG